MSKCEHGGSEFWGLSSVPVTLELDDGCSIMYFAIVVVASRREIHKFAVELDDL